MPAKGKTNASQLQANDRIIVHVTESGTVTPSATKTGEGVQVVRVVSKYFRNAQGRYEARGKYVIETTAGVFEAAAIQTMWLAPEDAAGIKRAYAEALAEDAERDANVVLVGVGSMEGMTSMIKDEAAMAPVSDAELLAALPLDVRGPMAEVAGLLPDGPVAGHLADASSVTGVRPQVEVPGLGVQVEFQPHPGLDSEPLPRATTYRISFERVGRKDHVADLEVTVPADAAWRAGEFVAEEVWFYVKASLASRDFTVDVNLETGDVLIGGGRFGKGKAQEVASQMA